MDNGGNNIMKKTLVVIFILITIGIFFSCNKSETKSETQNTKSIEDNNLKDQNNNNEQTSFETYKIELIELGSVKCIPCRKMQPILASIEKKYGNQIKVTFYDVCKDPAPAQKYGISIIPTQVFLDNKGFEIMRHEGFFPEVEIDKFLQSKGLKIIN